MSGNGMNGNFGGGGFLVDIPAGGYYLKVDKKRHILRLSSQMTSQMMCQVEVVEVLKQGKILPERV
jgi:hypothetical protein